MKKKKFASFLIVFLLLFINCTSPAYAQEPSSQEEENQDRTYAPYFFIENEEAGVDSFPLKETHVTANLSGVIADTYITQVYVNEGNTPITARYVFPASTRVAVHGMTMTVGNQVVTATIKEKETAKEEYEEAKSEGKTVSLMEQQRPNVFTMDIANIMPGDKVSIELHYTEMIVPVEGLYQFVFPTVVGPRYISSYPAAEQGEEVDEWVESPYLPEDTQQTGIYDIQVNLSPGVPITQLDSKSHEINIGWEEDRKAEVTLADTGEYAGNRDFILEYKLTGEETSTGLTLFSGSESGLEENFFMLSIQPPEHVQTKQIVPREYIFVLDVSGSMNGYPLNTAKKLIKNLVSSLGEKDYFNLVVFSDESYLLSESSLSTAADNLEKAMDLIDSQEGYGGTELNAALKTALKIPARQNTARSVVMITDGYISGETESFDLITENMDSASFFSFGIGSSVNRYLIEGMAAAGQGEAFIVTDEADATETAESFRTYITSPVLTDIEIDYGSFQVYDVAPVAPSTLYAKKPIVLFGKWEGSPEGTIQITGKTGDQDFVLDIPVSEERVTPDNSALPYLWARKRVEQLTDYGTFESNPDIQKEVTELGLTYNMATSYTSFIAVLDIVRNSKAESTDVNQPNPLPLQVSNLAIGGGYRLGSEPGLLLVAGAALLLPLIRHHRKRIGKDE